MFPSPAGPPVLHKNLLIFGLNTEIVYALDSATGKLCWKTETGRNLWRTSVTDQSPAVFLDQDTVGVCSASGVTAIHAITGKKQWMIDIEESVSRGAVQDGRRLYIETLGGTAYALDLREGKVAWSFTADGAPKKAEAVVRSEDASIPFPSSAWIDAKKTRNWSRQKLMARFCRQYHSQMDGKKMDRTAVLALLGQPEMSYEYPQGDAETAGKGSSTVKVPATITDHYQLSAKTGIFAVLYDEQGIVSGYHSSDEPCIFADYLGPSTTPPKVTVDMARRAASFQTITQVEQRLGPPGRSEVNVAPGFPTPLRNSSYLWNLSSDGRKVLWVRTCGPFDEDLAKRPIRVVCIISISPDCPVKH